MNDRSLAEELFFAALEKATPAERAAHLDEACAGNDTLRRRVETLLAAHSQVGQFLERPIAEAAGVTALGSLETCPTMGLSFVAPSSEPGSLGRLDHYEVLQVVGKGSTGVVLRARDTKLERIVAIKVLAPVLAITAPARQRFVREARAAAAISHDNVMAIHAVEEAGPAPYLVMQFIDGPTLQAKIDRTGPLSVEEILRIGQEIADGLAAAHRQGLIHRDIKPANILLENGIERVKITDFGLAHAAGEDSLTPAGFIAGTPAYMSPEQANGKRVDHRSDLYSLGSVLYALSTGQPPFRGRTTIEVLQAVREDTPRPARAVNRDVPAWLSELIARLHAKDPADRPTSAQAVADVLAEQLMGLSEPHTLRFRATHEAGQSGQRMGGVTTAYVASPRPRFGRRRRLWAAAAVLFLLVAGLGVSEATGVTDVRGTVIRLFSPEGTLVVEVDDPGVSVTVDGGDVVITGAGAKEIRLKPGQYKVEASKDGTLVRRELVTVARNGRQVVRISKESVDHVFNLRDPWQKSVAALPAEEQVEAVTKRLKELNPRFDERVEPTVRDGAVVGLAFNTDLVSDLSPVQALKRLESLDCNGTAERHGSVADLSPLRGLPLKRLVFTDNHVTDLSPLRGMPLKTLNFQRNLAIKDLKSLQGMPLELLDCAHTNVADLSPLKGMKLKHLSCDQTLVSDLSPLRGMALEVLGVCYCRLVTDLSPLRGMPLQRFGSVGSAVSDLSPLRGMPLKEILCDFQRERDGEFLRSFTTLERINGKSAAEFWKEVDGK
jgi:hypothetical protein